jgi:hypothetical protein
MNDVLYIAEEDFIQIKRVLEKNLYCSQCEMQHNAGMEVMLIQINDLNDILFSGICKNCGNILLRTIETGENPINVQRIKLLRKKLENKSDSKKRK